MFLKITSFYGKPCNIIINGGGVTINNKPTSEGWRLRLLDAIRPLETVLDDLPPEVWDGRNNPTGQ